MTGSIIQSVLPAVKRNRRAAASDLTLLFLRREHWPGLARRKSMPPRVRRFGGLHLHQQDRVYCSGGSTKVAISMQLVFVCDGKRKLYIASNSRSTTAAERQPLLLAYSNAVKPFESLAAKRSLGF